MERIKLYNLIEDENQYGLVEIGDFDVERITSVNATEDKTALVCTLEDGTTGYVPAGIRNENGKMVENPDIVKIVKFIRSKKSTLKEASDKQLPAVIEDDALVPSEIVDGNILREQDELSDLEDEQEIVDEEELDEEKSNKWKRWAATGILVGAGVLALACGLRGCGKSESESNEPQTTVETLDTYLEDSRYTEVTEESLFEVTSNFISVLESHGFTVGGEGADFTNQEVLYFVSLANITHIQNTNPELANKIFGDANVETVFSSAGHFMGKIVTNEITAKDDAADYWSVIFLNNTDRKIAEHDINMVETCKEIDAKCKEDIAKVDADTTLSASEKAEKIEAIKEQALIDVKVLVERTFVAPNYDTTIGYEIDDENHISGKQEDGAKFITNAMISGILMGDQDLKDYVNAPGYLMVTLGEGTEAQRYGIQSYVSHMEQGTIAGEANYSIERDETVESELTHDLQVISSNETTISDLTRIIEGCTNQNTETKETVKTMN